MPAARFICARTAAPRSMSARLHGRAIRLDERGKVLNYKMTSQCASGSGQFLENIARYLGIAQDEIGTLSKQADNPEKVSGICAVLAETDVINMVSRGITASNILKGIHESMADRLAKLLKTIGGLDGTIQMTGGLALDAGLVEAMKESMVREKVKVPIESHPDAIYAGAIGAALWGAFRHEKLARLAEQATPPERRYKGDIDMALMINEDCTACDACRPVCPNEAISCRRNDICHRCLALHRMCRRRGGTAMQARLPGGLHCRQSGLAGDARGTAGEIRTASFLNNLQERRHAIASA